MVMDKLYRSSEGIYNPITFSNTQSNVNGKLALRCIILHRSIWKKEIFIVVYIPYVSSGERKDNVKCST
jgi:hypothetical protein